MSKFRFSSPYTYVVLLGSLVLADHVIAEAPTQPIQAQVTSRFVPPHVFFQNREELDITDEQFQQFRQKMQAYKEKSEELRETAAKENKRLLEILDAESFDTEGAMGQIDAASEADKSARRAYLRMMAQVRSLVTKDQYAKARKLHKMAKEKAAESKN